MPQQSREVVPQLGLELPAALPRDPVAWVMTSSRFRCLLFSRNGPIRLRIKGLYAAISPCLGHGSGASLGGILPIAPRTLTNMSPRGWVLFLAGQNYFQGFRGPEESPPPPL